MTDILDLTKLTAPASGDALYIVDDPSGTPSDKYIEADDLILSRMGAQAATTSRTVNLDNTMTTAEIQAAIDGAQHYIAPDETLTFQFADGTYTLTATLSFDGFYGGGVLQIHGNASEDGNGLHTNQAVVLDSSATDINTVDIRNCCLSGIYFRYIKATGDTANGNQILLFMDVAAGRLFTKECYFLGNGTGDGEGIYYAYVGTGFSRDNYFSNMKKGIQGVYTGIIISSNNDDTGTDPAYGLDAIGTTLKKVGTQPDGSTANESTSSGGVIE